MSFGSRLKDKREALGITQPQLAEMLGVSKGAIGNWETDVNSPRATLLYDLFDILRCDANYLFQDETRDLYKDEATPEEFENLIKKYRFISKHSPDGAKTVDYILNREYSVAGQLKEWQDKNSTVSKTEEGQVIYLPELYSRFSAGTGQYSTDSGYEMTQVPRNALTSQATSIATISGDSMEPEYLNGDRVLVKTMPDIEVGEIGVWSINNELYIKAKGDGELISLNPDYDNIAIKENDSTYCIGKVLGKLD